MSEARDIPLDQIDTLPDHPFQVRDDEEMDELVESIRERGVIVPIIVRPKEDGRFEIVSGHRRRRACEILGMETIPGEVREMSRDEAIILMVDSNLHRSKILPSEKAFSYRMRLEAMKRQGQRSDLTLSPVATKLDSAAQIGEYSGESRDQVFRFIRLTHLDRQLLDLVDEGKIALRPAVELSYLNPYEQEALVQTIESEDATPSHAQAIRMRKISEKGDLNIDRIFEILTEQKPNQKEKLTLPMERLQPFLPRNTTQERAVAFVMKAVEHYRAFLQKQKNRER